MKFPKCTNGISPGVNFIVVNLATNLCFWDGACRAPAVIGGRGCTNTTDIVATNPDGFVTLSVSNASLGTVYGNGDSITDTLGSKEYWCDGAMVNVSLSTGSWFIGTTRCTVQHMQVLFELAAGLAQTLTHAPQTTGPNVHIENVQVAKFGPLVGVGLELVRVRGAYAVVMPPENRLSVQCAGLSATNSLVAVAACEDAWVADGPDTIAVYQDARAPSGDAGTVFSVDRYTDALFGRGYETRFYEGVTDVTASKDVMYTAFEFFAVSAGALALSWFLYG